MPDPIVTRGAHAYPPHAHAGRFTNLDPTPDRSLAEVLRWQLGGRRPGQRGAWRPWTDIAPQPAPPARVDAGVRVTWVNHATALVQLAGRNLLTDPVWAERASPVGFAGPRRRHAPGLALDALPPLDAVLLSHDHYDHLDVATLRALAARHRMPILTGLGNAAYLARAGVAGAVDLDWGDAARLAAGGGAVDVTFVPARHWSARGQGDRRRTLWGGFVIAAADARVYFAGDTGHGAHLADAGRRFGPFDVALLPIGAWRPEWFMSAVHMGPAEAVRAARELGARASVPIHHSTFRLADDGQDEALDVLRATLAAEADAPAFWLLAPGEGRTAGRGAAG